ncbi:HET-domain-containing protein, partial [Lophiostoma macrostomum CBS 122681]
MKTEYCSCRRPDFLDSGDGNTRVCIGCGAFAEPDHHHPYLHADLDRNRGSHIRLLQLLPGNYFDDIHGDLFEADLETDPEYEAVSYTWADENGDASLSRRIWLSKKLLMITINCQRALRRLRRQDASRTLWVDAICINQANLQERLHQVSQMKEVYQQARQVMIYVGEASDDSDFLLDYLDNSDWSPVRELQRRLAEAARNFFLRNWFHRIWVLQEVLLAR